MSVKKYQVVLRNSSGAVLNRSDVLQYVVTDFDLTVISIIRKWAFIGFSIGDTFAIEEVE